MAISQIKLSAKMTDSFRTDINCSQPFVIDQPKAGGGNDEGPNPLEIFLSSLPACICAIGRIVAKQERIDLRGITVDLEADIDKMFLLGKTTEGRAGFTEIRTIIDVDADMSPEEKEAFITKVEARCPVADVMISGTKIVHTIK